MAYQELLRAVSAPDDLVQALTKGSYELSLSTYLGEVPCLSDIMCTRCDHG